MAKMGKADQAKRSLIDSKNQMKSILKVVLFFLSATSMWSCDKDSVGLVPLPGSTAKCTIQSETYGLSGNEYSLGYEYDADGDLLRATIYQANGSVQAFFGIGSNTVKYNYTFSNKPASTEIEYDVSDLTSELPGQASTTLVNEYDATVFEDYEYFYFTYDSKKQLILVQQRNGPQKSGNELDIAFTYNEQGNVTKITNVYWTGPREDIPPVTVTGFDDKPNPHANIKAWRFLLVNHAWISSDPANLIAALSQNNPLGFSVGTGSNLLERKIVYEYNGDGLPTLQRNTNKTVNGEYTFDQTFTYACN